MKVESSFPSFGMVMKERSFSGSNYRFGFNGKEKDNEVKGEDNQQDYGFRIYDSRLGKFLSIDPQSKKYPFLSTYQFGSNSPISGIDVDGLEYFYAADGTMLGKMSNSTIVRLVGDAELGKITANLKTVNILETEAKTSKLDCFEEAVLNNCTGALMTSSKSTGMTNEELNARAFMTVVRKGEASSKTKISNDPLGYNVNFGGSKFDSYKTHPNKSPAGAYQFKMVTWKMVNGVEKQPDFSPQSQDRAFLLNVEIVNDDRPESKGALDDLYSGNFASAANKLNNTWTSLPNSGDESKMTVEQGESLFKIAVVNELAGKSAIATPQGELNTQKAYKEKKSK